MRTFFPFVSLARAFFSRCGICLWISFVYLACFAQQEAQSQSQDRRADKTLLSIGCKDCSITGNQLASLLRDESKLAADLSFSHMTVYGDVDLTEYSRSGNLIFTDCVFIGKIVLTGAHFGGNLAINRSIIVGGISGDNLHVDGQLFIRDHTLSTGDINLTDAFVKADISIADSEFRKDFVLRRGNVGANLLIQTSIFLHGLDCSFTEIGGSLNIGADVTVKGAPLIIDASIIGGRADLFAIRTYSSLWARNILVKSDLYITDVIDAASAPDTSDDKQSSISGAQIQGDLVFQGAVFDTGLRAERLKVGGSLLVQDCDLRHPCSNKDLTGILDMNDASIGNSVKISDYDLSRGFQAQRARVGGSFTIALRPDVQNERNQYQLTSSDINKLDRGHLGPSALIDAQVGGDLSIDNTEISGPDPGDRDGGALYLKGIHVGGTLYIGPNFKEHAGSLNILESRVLGNIEIWSSIFQSKFIAPLIHVDHSVFVHNSKFQALLLMNGANIIQHLDLAGNEFESVDLSRTNIGGDFRLEPDTNHIIYNQKTTWDPGSVLMLGSTRVGVVQDENENDTLAAIAWPSQVNLVNFHYQSFGNKRNIAWARRWILANRCYQSNERKLLRVGVEIDSQKMHADECDPNLIEPSFTNAHTSSDAIEKEADDDLYYQPDHALASYFRAVDDNEDADQLIIDSGDHELRQQAVRCVSLLKLDGCFKVLKLASLRLTISYGIGHWLTQILALAFFSVSLGFFALSFKGGREFPKYDRGYNWRFFASIHRLIPGLELREDFKNFFNDGEALNKLQQAYFFAHAMVGYIFVLFIAAGFTGLIQTK